jgi:hypothetical protein
LAVDANSGLVRGVKILAGEGAVDQISAHANLGLLNGNDPHVVDITGNVEDDRVGVVQLKRGGTVV